MVYEANSTLVAKELLFVVGSGHQLRHGSSWYITQQPERVVRYTASFAKHGLLLFSKFLHYYHYLLLYSTAVFQLNVG